MTIEVTEELKSLGIEGPQIRAIIGNIRDDKKIAMTAATTNGLAGYIHEFQIR